MEDLPELEAEFTDFRFWNRFEYDPLDVAIDLLPYPELEKGKYSAEELHSTMESIKTRLIILCEMRGL